ncbi:hypothetical protein L1887_15458 [Cichorium endivia]|nr:hypothetical protein L1887_15458 [Cichorium endivia]
MTPANTNRFTPSLSRCSSLNSDGSAAARLHYSPLLNLSHSPSRFLCQFPFSSSKEEERGKRQRRGIRSSRWWLDRIAESHKIRDVRGISPPSSPVSVKGTI